MEKNEEVKKILKFEFKLISSMPDKELDFNIEQVAPRICRLFLKTKDNPSGYDATNKRN